MEMGFWHPKVTWSEFLFMSWWFFTVWSFLTEERGGPQHFCSLLNRQDDSPKKSAIFFLLLLLQLSSYLQNPKKEALAVVQCVPLQHLRLLSSSLRIWKLARQKKEHGSMGMCFQQENIELAHRAGQKIYLHRSKYCRIKKKKQKLQAFGLTPHCKKLW